MTTAGIFQINKCGMRNDKLGFNLGVPSLLIEIIGEWKLFTKSYVTELLEAMFEDVLETIQTTLPTNTTNNTTNTTTNTTANTTTKTTINTTTKTTKPAMSWKNIVSGNGSDKIVKDVLETLPTEPTAKEGLIKGKEPVKISSLFYDISCFEPPYYNCSLYGIESYVMKALIEMINNNKINNWMFDIIRNMTVMGYQMYPKMLRIEEDVYGIKFDIECSTIYVGEPEENSTKLYSLFFYSNILSDDISVLSDSEYSEGESEIFENDNLLEMEDL